MAKTVKLYVVTERASVLGGPRLGTADARFLGYTRTGQPIFRRQWASRPWRPMRYETALALVNQMRAWEAQRQSCQPVDAPDTAFYEYRMEQAFGY